MDKMKAILDNFMYDMDYTKESFEGITVTNRVNSDLLKWCEKVAVNYTNKLFEVVYTKVLKLL